MPVATLEPETIVSIVRNGWERFIEREASRGPADQPRDYVRASQWRACDRAMVYDLMAAPRPAWTPEQLANFRRGSDRERDLLRDLATIGRNADPPFAVTEQQITVRLKGRNGRDVIVGHCDGVLSIPSLDKRYPIEVKSWSPNLVARIETFSDLLRSPYTRSGAYQLLAYLYGHSEPLGFLILDRHGIPLLIPVELEPHLDLMEQFLARAEAAVEAKAGGKTPDFIRDADECRRCPYFGGTCQPTLDYGKGAQVVADEELLAALDRREELKRAAEEFAELDEVVKKKLRGVEMAVAGNFLIEGRWAQKTFYTPPEDVQRKINELQAPFKQVEPHGSFRLKITRV